MFVGRDSRIDGDAFLDVFSTICYHFLETYSTPARSCPVTVSEALPAWTRSEMAAVKNHNPWINDRATTTSRMGLKRNTSPAIAKTPPSTSDAYPNAWGSTREPRMTTPTGDKTAGAATMGKRCWRAAIRS